MQLLYKVLVEDAPEGYYRQLETTVNTDPTLSSIADSPPLDNDIEDESIQVQVSTQEEEEEDVKVELKGNFVCLLSVYQLNKYENIICASSRILNFTVCV